MSNRILGCLVLASLWVCAGSAAAADWPQFGFDSRHSGVNLLESTLDRGNVPTLHVLYHVTLPSIADGAPALLTGVSTVSGTKDLLFLTTKAGHLLALDAATGATVWSQRPATGPNYTTSSPAVDPSRQFVYSYGLEGRVHKYRVGDGTEVASGGWPQVATLKPSVEKGSSALSVVTTVGGASYLYVTNGGYPGDAGDYQGHVTAVDLTSGAQQVFNAACSDQTVHFVLGGTPDCPLVQTAIWARAGVVYDSDNDRLFMATGNGTFNANAGGFGWGDSVFSLHPDGTGNGLGQPVDSYTPTEYQQLDNADLDLGSTTPALLPVLPGSSVAHLGVQSGKDGKVRLLGLDNLSGAGGPGHVAGELQKLDLPQGGEVLTAPAVWTDPIDGGVWVFITNDSGISGLQATVSGGVPSLTPRWTVFSGGTSPIVANGVLYYAGAGVVHAVDPTTGSSLWNGTSIGGIHWESPIVVNGRLYLTDEGGQLWAYEPSASPHPPAPRDLNGDGRSDLVWRHTSGATYVWLMDGTSLLGHGFTVLQADGSWQIEGIADFNGDGRADLLWRHTSGTTAVWFMNGTTVTGGGFTAAQQDDSWQVAGTGDFNGDGKADILWRHSSGELFLWLMNGTSLLGSSGPAGPTVGLDWQVAEIGDFNGDGKADILWRHTSGATAVWFMNGTTVTGGGFTAAQQDDSWQVAGTGDFNGDGKADILWRHSSGELFLWLMNGTSLLGSSGPAGPTVGLDWQVAEIGDFNGDGEADILWRHTSGATAVWFMNGTSLVGKGPTAAQASNNWTLQAP